MYQVLLDTTYILPLFGVEIKGYSGEEISKKLGRLINIGVNVHLSKASLLEAFLKTITLSKKLKRDALLDKAVEGVEIIRNDDKIILIEYIERGILEEAKDILREHKDPFDAIIFATAIVGEYILITEDEAASKFVAKNKIIKLKNIDNILDS